MNNKGQVGVIVAILMVTLLVSILVVIQVYYIPQWMKEREAEHMDDVMNQFASLKYSMDLEATEQSASPLTTSITLGSKELPYFVSSRAFGSLEILSTTSSNFGISISGSGMLAQTYTYDGATQNLSYVLSINSFKLDIDSLASGDFYNASINDMRTTVNISVSIGNFGSNHLQINMSIINGTTTVFNQTVAVGLKSGNSYIINLLNSEYPLSEILPHLHTPFNMSFSTSNHGNFEVVCRKYISSTISYSASMGSIQYHADNAYFVDQDYIFEGGAVILNQSTGDTLLYPPLLFISSGNPSFFNITLIDVRGVAGKTSVAGYGTYSIRTNFSSLSRYECRANSLTINISTSFPGAWKKYFENEMERSGIPSGNYTISPGSNYVTITIDIPISFTLNRAVIYAQVGPGWVT